MYSNDVRFVFGRDNQAADVMSCPTRVPLGSSYTLDVEDDEAVMPAEDDPPLPELAAITELLVFQTVSQQELYDAQQQCPDDCNHKKGNHLRTINMKYIETAPGVMLNFDVSRCRQRPFASSQVPSSFRRIIFNLFHMLNHNGQAKTLKKMEDRYYWPTIRHDISDWIKAIWQQVVRGFSMGVIV